MRTNKFIPFGIALLVHLCPIFYYLILNSNRTHKEKSISLTTIDLSTFSPSTSVKDSKKTLRNNEERPTEIVSSVSSNNQALVANTNKNEEGTIVFLSKDEPVYPKIARVKGYEGTVKIKAFYDSKGTIEKVDIIQSSGNKILDESVQKTVSTWRLSSVQNGNFEKTFTFKLNN